MDITELLNEKSINLDMKAKNKSEMMKKLAKLMFDAGYVLDEAKFEEELEAREKISTTAVGEGIAIPHAKSKYVKKAGIGAAVVKEGVDFDSDDGEKSYLFFVIAAPENAENTHLDALGALSGMLMDENFRKRLLDSKSKKEFMDTIRKAQQAETETPENGAYEILAVTACPTGIAHTYMAAEGLENAAKKLGVSIKVETNGTSGVKNRLTEDEIKNAKAIIVAADRQVEMGRFNGKPLIKTKVSEGINRPEELINNALSGKALIYESNESTNAVPKEKGGAHSIYTNLMNGISYMLPFVIGGGILIAIAFLLDDYSIDPKNFGMNTPIAAFFKTAGGAAFSFMLPVLAGYIAMSIGDKAALAAGFAGGYLANAGGSGFLGALLAGFAAGYITLAVKKLLERLPESLSGVKSILFYPVLSILITAFAIEFLLNPPVKAINDALYAFLNSMGSGSRVVLGMVLGAMMAIDMGGPVNKAAYVFGTASIAQQRYDIMAAVMVGGMVPPLAIALCATFFGRKFTSKERKSAAANYIMGLSFITEGAIPFAAADPIRVIPACAIGSAVAGGLSMFFGCTLMAPHGGIFVFLLVGKWFLYLVSLIVGSVVGMAVLALLKKDAKGELK